MISNSGRKQTKNIRDNFLPSFCSHIVTKLLRPKTRVRLDTSSQFCCVNGKLKQMNIADGMANDKWLGNIHQSGVAIVMIRYVSRCLEISSPVSDRITTAKFHYKYRCMQVYAPSSSVCSNQRNRRRGKRNLLRSAAEGIGCSSHAINQQRFFMERGSC